MRKQIRTDTDHFGHSILPILGLTACLFIGLPVVKADSNDPGKVIATIPVSNPSLVAVNPTTNRFYVTNFEFPNTRLLVYDGASNSRIATLTVGSPVCAVAVNRASNRVYLTLNAGYYGRYGAGSLTALDGASNTIISTTTVTSPCDMVINPTTNRLYVVNEPWNAAPSLLVYDGEMNDLIASVPLPAGSFNHRLGVNPTTNRIYVIDLFSNDILVINGETNSVTGTITVPAGGYTYGVAVNPATNRVYMHNVGSDSGNLWVIDGTTNSVITLVTLGSYGSGVAVNPVSNRIYAGKLEVTDGVTNTSIGSVPESGASGGASPAASSVAVNPATNLVYAIKGPGDVDGVFVGGRILVIAECALNSAGNFVCPRTLPLLRPKLNRIPLYRNIVTYP